MRFLRRNEPKDPVLYGLSKVLPDRWMDEQYPQRRTRNPGRHRDLKTSQLVRIHLLVLIKGLRSFNCVCRELKHNIDFRRFCRLRPEQQPLTPGCLSKFRASFGLSGWTALHRITVRSLLKLIPPSPIGIVVIDSTDFPAAVRKTRKKRVTFRLQSEWIALEPHAGLAR